VTTVVPKLLPAPSVTAPGTASVTAPGTASVPRIADVAQGLASARLAAVERQLTTSLALRDLTTEPIAVLRVDIDGFRVLYERYGERVAGEVVATVVVRMGAALPVETTVLQLDTDEFSIVMEGAARATVLELAHRVVREVGCPLVVRDIDLLPTVSIGVTFSQPNSTAAELLDESGEALHRARNRGGDRVDIFDDAMRHRARETASFAEDLRYAIAHHQLRVAYQPIVTIDGELSGLEALVRWEHPTRGRISPTQIIDIAEEKGMIHEIGRLVLRQACTDVAAWRRRRPDLTVSVNLSGRQLVRTNIVTEIEQCLTAAGLAPSALCLEITETVLMDDPTVATAALKQLVGKGIRVAIDDFGTGYSSLLYLRRFPLNSLKLDRLFVAGIESETQNREIVGFVIQLAHSLGMTTVAEGVETTAQIDTLRELGCDLVQGYYWSKAVAADEITRMIEDGGVLQGSAYIEMDFFRPFADSYITAPADFAGAFAGR
jgi:diguanylate cyclase (GGDEF)-like protein